MKIRDIPINRQLRENPELRASVDARAASAGITNETWPYGANNNLFTRDRLLDWAIGHDLRLARKRDWCLHWLVGVRCPDTACKSVYLRDQLTAISPDHGFGDLSAAGIELGNTATSDWLDHVTLWTRGGSPAAIVAQPYGLCDEYREGLLKLGTKPGLRVEIDDAGGWYGMGTTWVAIWRDGEVRLPSPSLVCDSCGAVRSGSWWVNRETHVLRCLKCAIAEGLTGPRPRDRENSPWLEARRREVTRWLRGAQFLFDAPAKDQEDL
ncbi:hypothetical protein [Brachybacterium sp. NPDC056505]|uniref:hypothetical protein n=1 Tax=Brachybacterium sp. NPDC056505 TaxID=3345843 RepID=UPI00366B35F0